MKLKLGLYQIVLVSFLLLNSGCKTINAVVPPSTDITFNASADINPDINDRPSPVVVKIFELSSRTIFHLVGVQSSQSILLVMMMSLSTSKK